MIQFRAALCQCTVEVDVLGEDPGGQHIVPVPHKRVDLRVKRDRVKTQGGGGREGLGVVQRTAGLNAGKVSAAPATGLVKLVNIVR